MTYDYTFEEYITLKYYPAEWMITYFCKPKLKVGTEWVQKGSTCTNAANSVAGIARAIYERTFRITVSSGMTVYVSSLSSAYSFLHFFLLCHNHHLG